jgi:non-specific serine/threonine protein kinase/serine/threonine-protein kinase
MKYPDSDSRPDPARVEQLFHSASELPEGEQAAFLLQACGEDQRLFFCVRSLLSAARTNTGWDRTALELEARHSAIDSRPALPGESFGPYRILRRVAAGGMSLVYEALRDDAEFHKRVAIKFVHRGIDDRGLGERFRSERQILAQLEHPYIARLLDGGTTPDDVPYLVMEYVDGLTIDRFVAEHRLPRTERLQLFLQVCEAVQYAHRNLVVHRDLKPANILVTTGGMVKLLDFGIAKLITSEPAGQATTVRALTPEYASPEQMIGRKITTSTDVYSLGVLLFVLLADRLPYGPGAAQPAALLRAICQDEPVWEPRGLIEGDLESIVAKALRKEPERRYLSVEQFSADLRRYLAGMPVTARPDTLFYRARKFAVRRAVLLAAVSALAVAILVGLTASLWEARRAERQGLIAQRRFDDVRTLARSLLFDVYNSISALPGSLPARRLLASRAQQYLDSLEREAGNDSDLARELAESYLRLGDVLGSPYAANLGDTSGALESFRKAAALLEREAAQDASSPGVQEQLAQAHATLGAVLVRMGKAEEAVSVLKQAAAEAEALYHRNHDFSHAQKLSLAYSYLAQAQGAAALKGSVPASEELATSRKALEILEAAGPRPEESWQVSLASRHFRVGYALRALGDSTGEISYYRQALDIQLKGDAVLRALAASNPGRPYRRELADDLLTIALSRWRCCRDLSGAMRDVHAALESFERVAHEDPHDREARRDVANTYKVGGECLAEAGRRLEALEMSRKALALYEELGRADPASAENVAFLSQVRTQIARLDRGR